MGQCQSREVVSSASTIATDRATVTPHKINKTSKRRRKSSRRSSKQQQQKVRIEVVPSGDTLSSYSSNSKSLLLLSPSNNTDATDPLTPSSSIFSSSSPPPALESDNDDDEDEHHADDEDETVAISKLTTTPPPLTRLEEVAEEENDNDQHNDRQQALSSMFVETPSLRYTDDLDSVIPEEEDPDAPSDEEDFHEQIMSLQGAKVGEWLEEPGPLIPAQQSPRSRRQRSLSPPMSQSCVKLRKGRVTRPGSVVHHHPPPLIAPTPEQADRLAASVAVKSKNKKNNNKAVQPFTLSEFKKLKVQVKLANRQERIRRRTAKLEDRYEDVRGYKSLWNEYEQIQQKMETNSQEGEPLRRSNSFDLQHADSWYFDFQSLNGDEDDDTDNASQSSLSLLSTSSMEAQKMLFAEKRRERHMRKFGQQNWDEVDEEKKTELLETDTRSRRSHDSSAMSDYGPMHRRHSDSLTNFEVSYVSTPPRREDSANDDLSDLDSDNNDYRVPRRRRIRYMPRSSSLSADNDNMECGQQTLQQQQQQQVDQQQLDQQPQETPAPDNHDNDNDDNIMMQQQPNENVATTTANGKDTSRVITDHVLSLASDEGVVRWRKFTNEMKQEIVMGNAAKCLETLYASQGISKKENHQEEQMRDIFQKMNQETRANDEKSTPAATVTKTSTDTSTRTTEMTNDTSTRTTLPSDSVTKTSTEMTNDANTRTLPSDSVPKRKRKNNSDANNNAVSTTRAKKDILARNNKSKNKNFTSPSRNEYTEVFRNMSTEEFLMMSDYSKAANNHDDEDAKYNKTIRSMPTDAFLMMSTGFAPNWSDEEEEEEAPEDEIAMTTAARALAAEQENDPVKDHSSVASRGPFDETSFTKQDEPHYERQQSPLLDNNIDKGFIIGSLAEDDNNDRVIDESFISEEVDDNNNNDKDGDIDECFISEEVDDNNNNNNDGEIDESFIESVAEEVDALLDSFRDMEMEDFPRVETSAGKRLPVGDEERYQHTVKQLHEDTAAAIAATNAALAAADAALAAVDDTYAV